jgi:hypothetical protein
LSDFPDNPPQALNEVVRRVPEGCEEEWQGAWCGVELEQARNPTANLTQQKIGAGTFPIENVRTVPLQIFVVRI